MVNTNRTDFALITIKYQRRQIKYQFDEISQRGRVGSKLYVFACGCEWKKKENKRVAFTLILVSNSSGRRANFPPHFPLWGRRGSAPRPPVAQLWNFSIRTDAFTFLSARCSAEEIRKSRTSYFPRKNVETCVGRCTNLCCNVFVKLHVCKS